MLYAFQMDVATAQEFYRRCEEYKADTEKERHAILVQMVHEGLIKGVTATERTKEEYVQDLKRNFSVLDTTEGFGDGQ